MIFQRCSFGEMPGNISNFLGKNAKKHLKYGKNAKK